MTKLLEKENREIRDQLDGFYPMLKRWGEYCEENLGKFFASENLGRGLLNEVIFQNAKIELFEYAGRVYTSLIKHRVAIEKIDKMGRISKTIIDSSISSIDESLLQIIELIHTIPLHNA